MYKLREARTQAKMKQKDIAALLNITPATYSRYESGQIQPNNTILIQLSKILKVSIGYLLGSESKPEPQNTTPLPDDSNITIQTDIISSNNNDIKTILTLEAIEKILKMNIEELKALNIILKTMK